MSDSESDCTIMSAEVLPPQSVARTLTQTMNVEVEEVTEIPPK